MINAGGIIGSGIFMVPATVALYTQSSSLFFLVWFLGGIVTLFGALSIAELGASMPKAGGQYVYLNEAYGPLWGFLYGWSAITVINTASIAAIGHHYEARYRSIIATHQLFIGIYRPT